MRSFVVRDDCLDYVDTIWFAGDCPLLYQGDGKELG
jgi:hypothetical protein